MHGTVLPSPPATPTGLSGCTRTPRAQGPPMEPGPSPLGSGAALRAACPAAAGAAPPCADELQVLRAAAALAAQPFPKTPKTHAFPESRRRIDSSSRRLEYLSIRGWLPRSGQS